MRSGGKKRDLGEFEEGGGGRADVGGGRRERRGANFLAVGVGGLQKNMI